MYDIKKYSYIIYNEQTPEIIRLSEIGLCDHRVSHAGYEIGYQYEFNLGLYLEFSYPRIALVSAAGSAHLLH